jgi:hypothetical protein
MAPAPDTVLLNARVTTLDRSNPEAEAVAIRDGRIMAVGLNRKLAMGCGCTNACNIHGHAHASAWSSCPPVSDLRSFWGALGCACWAL